MKQHPVARAEAILRLSAEDCRPIEDFTSLAGVSKETLLRWAIEGTHGLHLDALRDRATGTFLTSAQAVARFVVALAERRAAVKAKGGAP